jgi:hypothetical protein
MYNFFADFQFPILITLPVSLHDCFAKTVSPSGWRLEFHKFVTGKGKDISD